MPTPEPDGEADLRLRREVGERIRCLRRARGLSQEDLGELIGVDRRAISTYEVGSVALSLDRVGAICRALRVETWRLFYG
ncbi:hypothetical protein AMK19_23625 [Kitasatospora sp. CB01950]|nr:hypothetical protein AMK19_23625 [Kitasatospora sp. CB01950]